MRCLSCDEPMRPYDRTRKTLSGHFVDLCFKCYREIKFDLPTVGNPALFNEDDEETTVFDVGVDNRNYDCYNSTIEDKEDDNEY